MHFVTEGDVPCWYYLSFENHTLSVHMHPKAFECAMDEITSKMPLIGDLQDDLNLEAFSLAADKWGFGETAFWKKDSRGWETVHFPYPETRHGIIEFLPPGKEMLLYILTANLGIMFIALNNFDGQTNCGMPQGMTVQIFPPRSDFSGSLTASLSPAFLQWLGDNYPIPAAQGKMTEAHAWLWDKDGTYDYSDFVSYVEDGIYIHLNCPGNACGLDPEDYDVPPEQGYRLQPHNLDHPAQQLTLLAGLASFSEQFHKTAKDT